MSARILLPLACALLSLGWASAAASQPASSLMSNDQAIQFWQERVKRDAQEAIRLMEVAAEEERHARLTQEGGAWYQIRLGEMHFNSGRLAEAATHYEAALKEYAHSYVALAGLGRVRAAQGKTAEAI